MLPLAQASGLAKPPVELYQSFYDREWRSSLITELRILGGGPSCKAFSGAGKQQFLDDGRANGFRDTAECVKRFLPDVTLLEITKEFITDDWDHGK